MKGLDSNILFFFSDNLKEQEIHPGSVAHAYLAILNEDLDSAKTIFSKNDSPRGKWGCSFVSVLNGFMTDFPTYFGIRNFLEIDLDFLIKNNKINFVEQCLGALELFSSINQETYKFAARAMLENHLNMAALKYMDKSKQIYYNDAELHFMYAKYYMDINNYQNAYFYVQECLKMIPSYYPALLMKQKIEEIGF